MFPSYRNQSVNLQSKSTDWFLYDRNIGRLRVKFHDLFWTVHDSYEACSLKTNVYNNFRAVTHIFILDPVK